MIIINLVKPKHTMRNIGRNNDLQGFFFVYRLLLRKSKKKIKSWCTSELPREKDLKFIIFFE